ncbi:MAG: RNA methyltransferase PUA domain-containing protein, partial [Lentisphaeria bacterium]
MRKFYIPEISGIGTLLQLSEVESRHFATVLRGKVGESIRLLNGKGVLATGEVRSID